MKISYQWLTAYLPVHPGPRELSGILTSIGLEVENLERFEEVPGSLEGLVIGEVLEVSPHPGADRLKLTRVDAGGQEPLRIVCGAPNVAPGQKVVVAPVGATLHPVEGEPLTLKKARIRGEESQGMLCAEDEIGVGRAHDGILVLDTDLSPGSPAAAYFQPEEDWIYEIGLTPNRMDAMSHLGVARDVCAWLSHHEGREIRPVAVPLDDFRVADTSLPIAVEVKEPAACPRYAGLSLSGVQVAESPKWLKQRLRAIGVRPINNIVDVTNFVLHETGQPLHAFDADRIAGHRVIVRNLPAGTPFVTLDGRERKLDAADLMITDPEGGLCLAGIFGGAGSGVTDATTRLFLESACFSPAVIRRASFRHDLRTDAALRFEKGVDISGVPYALKRAALLICTLSGARVSSEITDVYPDPRPRTQVRLSHNYLHRLSGKAYPPAQVTGILRSLGFAVTGEDGADLVAEVPYSKPDISLPADLAEEIMRIDGYDHIAIPDHIRIAPAAGSPADGEIRHRLSAYLTAGGFYEILTNSITRGGYYPDGRSLVRLMNSLNSELDVMRPSLLETGLEAVAYNLNRRQGDLLLFEFGKTYGQTEAGYSETPQLALYLTGRKTAESWRTRPEDTDLYFLKGHIESLFRLLGMPDPAFAPGDVPVAGLTRTLSVLAANRPAGLIGAPDAPILEKFGIRQPVLYAELDWKTLVAGAASARTVYREIPRHPSVRRDLALILDKHIPFENIREAIHSVKSDILQHITLFDVFESEKLGRNKKSLALGFTFQSPGKTLTDKEIDKTMGLFSGVLENRLQAEIRKG